MDPERHIRPTLDRPSVLTHVEDHPILHMTAPGIILSVERTIRQERNPPDSPGGFSYSLSLALSLVLALLGFGVPGTARGRRRRRRRGWWAPQAFPQARRWRRLMAMLSNGGRAQVSCSTMYHSALVAAAKIAAKSSTPSPTSAKVGVGPAVMSLR